MKGLAGDGINRLLPEQEGRPLGDKVSRDIGVCGTLSQVLSDETIGECHLERLLEGLEHLIVGATLEKDRPGEEFGHCRCQAPQVDWVRHGRQTKDDFGGPVKARHEVGGGEGGLIVGRGGGTKVGNHNPAKIRRRDEDVVRFEIGMDDATGPEVFEGGQQLRKVGLDRRQTESDAPPEPLQDRS